MLCSSFTNYFAFLSSLVVIICMGFYFFLKKKYSYWKECGIASPEPHMVFGTMKKVFTMKQTEAECMDDLYKEYKNEKYVGIYNLWKPALLVKDLELLENMTEKQFSHFMDHPEFHGHAESDGIFDSLMFLRGSIWKHRRQEFTRLFSAKKLEDYIEELKKSHQRMLAEIDTFVEHEEDIELMRMFEKYSVRSINTNFYSTDLSEDDEAVKTFVDMANVFVHPPPEAALKFLFYSISPKLHTFLRIKTFPVKVWNFYKQLTLQLLEARENAKTDTFDLLTIIKKLRDGSTEFGKIGIRETVAHMYVFLVAAHSTTLLTLSLTLLQLSLHPEVQQKVRKELDEVLSSEKNISYSLLSKIPYLDCVIKETLRMFPVIGVQKRMCTKPYRLNDNYTIPEGMLVFFPVYSIQNDEKYFSEPNKFIPERFYLENKHPAYMPFGKGPRMCIGKSYGEAVVRLTLVRILSKYSVEPSGKMKLPMRFDPSTLLVTSRPCGGIWTKLRRRTNAPEIE